MRINSKKKEKTPKTNKYEATYKTDFCLFDSRFLILKGKTNRFNATQLTH